MLEDLKSVELNLGKDIPVKRKLGLTVRSTIARLSLRKGVRTVAFALSVLSFVVVLSVIWISSRSSRPPEPSPEAKRLYQAGVDALRNGSYLKASRLFEQTIQTDARFPLAHARLAETWMELDYEEKATEEMLRVTELASNLSNQPALDMLYLQAITATVRGNYKGAVENFEEIVRRIPEDGKTSAYFDLGRAYERARDVDKAAGAYQEVPRRDAQAAAAFLRVGGVYGRKQEDAKAVAAFDKAYELYDAQGNPLVIRERVVGLIYLDTSNPAIVLDEGHLQLLTAVGAIAAVAIENVQHLEWLQGENQRLHEEINLEHNMIGESPRMREVFRFIEKIAPTDATVLIRGESGTGKELVAHAIHDNSERSTKQFVAINCAVLSEALLESELFGHEKGAFTGAVAQKRGRLEIADGGTLFLDEVGELTAATQAKLLRVLQERQFERLGSTRTLSIDVRVIAATNRNLEEAIKAGTFRQDLYYRLNVISLTLPALRERREDIALLAYYFVAKYSKKCKRLVSGIAPETRNYLLAYDWPGNVREMENAIERAVVLGNTDLIVPDDLPESLLTTSPTAQNSPNYHEAVNEMKKQFILRALEQANGNYTEAAKLLGIHSTNLHRLIRTLGLRPSLRES